MSVLGLADAINYLRADFNFSVTSWWRTPKRNKDVGGKSNSRHLVGLGMDIILDDAAQTQEFIKAAKGYRLLAINEGDHIHVQTID